MAGLLPPDTVRTTAILDRTDLHGSARRLAPIECMDVGRIASARRMAILLPTFRCGSTRGCLMTGFLRPETNLRSTPPCVAEHIWTELRELADRIAPARDPSILRATTRIS